MSIQFEQSEVESMLSDVLKRDDRTDIARITGIHYTVIKEGFNPDNERKSAAFQFLQIQCALDEISPERGEEFFQTIKRIRELSMKRKANGEELCAGQETGKLNEEVAQAVSAYMSGKSFVVQLKEIDDIEKQLPVAREAVLCAAKKERESIQGNNFADLKAVA